MRALSLLAVLSVTSAFGQTLSTQLDTGPSVSVGPGDCNSGVHTIAWTASLPQTTDQACSDLYIWLNPSGSCEDQPDGGGGEYIVSDVSDSTSASGGAWFNILSASPTFATNALPNGTDGGLLCGTRGVDVTFAVCGSFKWAPIGTDCNDPNLAHYASGATGVTFEYNAQPPPAPTLSVSPGDTTVTAIMSDSSTKVIQLYAQFRVAAQDGGAAGVFVTGGSAAGTSGNVTIPNLTDGVLYDFLAYAVDAAGNQSPDSDIVQAMPVLTDGFFSLYIKDGGKEQGGCSFGFEALPWLGAAVAARELLRRRRR